MKVFVKGLNTCAQRNHKLGQYLTFLRGNGHEVAASAEEAEVILVWTCGFRGDVRDNSLAQLAAYGAAFPGRVTAVGCLPRIAPGKLAEQFEGEIVAWTDELALEARFGTGAMTLAQAEAVYARPAKCTDAARFRAENPDADVIFHDQYTQVLVAEGCPFQCTYCSERLAFPPFRSFDAVHVIDAAVATMREANHYDLILIADCLGEYGRDTGDNLPDLVRRIAAAEPRTRVALNHMHPLNLIRDLDAYSALIAEGLVCHINLPIQSANDRVLRLMDRRYTRTGLEIAFRRLTDLGFRDFDTHVIVGFPGETDAEFEETIAFLLTYRPRHVLLSQFMDCEDAPATRLPGKLELETMARRSASAQARLVAAGILCNNEGSDLIRERLRRLNKARTG